MKQIASRDNPFLKRLRRLLTSTAARREAGETLLDGSHLVAAYLDGVSESSIEIAVARSRADSPEIHSLVNRVDDGRVVVVEDSVFDTLSPSDTPAGIVAVIPIPPNVAKSGGDCLLLESIQDPGNMGAMLRTARAAGFGQIYLSPGCADPWSPKCLRGGMGAHFGLSIVENADLVAVLKTFTGRSIACDPHGQHSLFDVTLPSPLAVVVGAEGAGLSPALRAATTHRCRIPMSHDTESLNAGVAAAIVMYEHLRQSLAHP